jgi:putative membrane protein
MESATRTNLTYLAIFLAVLAWSAWRPHDYFTWFLEAVPAMAGAALLAALYPRFRLSQLLYAVILVHCIVLVVGGKYTYAENPLFNWLRDALNLERNYYDRLGHFLQGFTPALVARELFLRQRVFNRPGWIPFVCVCVALAISACYEFIEWWVALATGEAAEAFLGTQGDVWDTQWDMFMATAGAVAAMVFFRRLQDRALAGILMKA